MTITMTFDDYLSNRVKLGKSQYLYFLILSMIEFMEGFQEVFQAILIRILKTEWEITIHEQALLGSLFFIGIMFGNIICSITADRFGRKVMLIISQALSILMMLINSLSIYYYQVAITIFFYGLLFGISMPISQVMVSEIFPVKVRGIFIVLLQFIYILGILYLILMCYAFLDSFDEGNWRGLLLANIVPALVCLVGAILLLEESPRMLIYNGDFNAGFGLLDRMGKMNNVSYESITPVEQAAIIEWQQSLQVEQITVKEKFYGLFKPGSLRITIFLWSIFIMFNVISGGLSIITPYLYKDAEGSFADMLLAYSCEIPGIIFVVMIFENQRYGGRIKCTIYGLFIMTAVQLGLYLYQEQFLRTGFMFIRFGFRVVWSCLNALPAESYSTSFRSMGVGAAQGIGKISGASSSFVTIPLYYQSAYLPFLFGALMSTFGMILMAFYPVDATQKQLDRQQQGKSEVKEGGAEVAQHEGVVDKQFNYF